jgi:hypothetical protein
MALETLAVFFCRDIGNDPAVIFVRPDIEDRNFVLTETLHDATTTKRTPMS